ncbi:hypothetical protein V8B97DRAFT_1872886 [Scleroderma yunnanense]
MSEAHLGGGDRADGKERDKEEEAAGSNKSSDESSDSGSDGFRRNKRSRLHLDVSRFPWAKRREVQVATLPEDIRTTFEQIKLYSRDPKRVVEHILSSPGCPPFPPSQWLNLVQWKYVDLAKVLESAHTTELDPKQTHVIDEKVELSFRISKPVGVIGSAADHITAFTMLVKAVAFVFPQRWDEFSEYQTYIGRLFHSTQLSFHARVIDYDRAVRNRVSVQCHLRITDPTNFDDLHTAFLSSHGVGSHSSESSPSTRYTTKSGPSSQRREPCHKWNRGLCQKSVPDCLYAHCCDRRGCRGNHKRPDYHKIGKGQ